MILVKISPSYSNFSELPRVSYPASQSPRGYHTAQSQSPRGIIPWGVNARSFSKTYLTSLTLELGYHTAQSQSPQGIM